MTPDRRRIATGMRRDNARIRAIAEALGVGRSKVARHLASNQPPAWVSQRGGDNASLDG